MTEFFSGISCLKIFEFISTPQRLLNDAPQSLEFSVEEQKSYQVLQVQEVRRSKLIHVYFMFHDFRAQIIIFWFSLDLKSRCQVQLSRCLVRKPFEPKKNIRSNSLTKIIRCFHGRGFIEDSLENSLSKHNLTIHWAWQKSVPLPRITASHGDGNLMATLKEIIGIGILRNTTKKFAACSSHKFAMPSVPVRGACHVGRCFVFSFGREWMIFDARNKWFRLNPCRLFGIQPLPLSVVYRI